MTVVMCDKRCERISFLCFFVLVAIALCAIKFHTKHGTIIIIISSSSFIQQMLFLILMVFLLSSKTAHANEQKEKTTLCLDNDNSCASWARNGLCQSNASTMLSLCPMSCSTCTHGVIDKEHCGDWASHGECDLNPEYMREHCPSACGFSVTMCDDTSLACQNLINKDMTACEDPVFLTLCPASCGICRSSCVDMTNSCPNWVLDGYAELNARSILHKCSLSAGICVHRPEYEDVIPTNDHEQSPHRQSQQLPCEDFNKTLCRMWGTKLVL